MHTHHDRNTYIVGLYKTFRIPRGLVMDITRKGLPLLVNEFL